MPLDSIPNTPTVHLDRPQIHGPSPPRVRRRSTIRERLSSCQKLTSPKRSSNFSQPNRSKTRPPLPAFSPPWPNGQKRKIMNTNPIEFGATGLARSSQDNSTNPTAPQSEISNLKSENSSPLPSVSSARPAAAAMPSVVNQSERTPTHAAPPQSQIVNYQSSIINSSSEHNQAPKSLEQVAQRSSPEENLSHRSQ
jgi:hypothetical protein